MNLEEKYSAMFADEISKKIDSEILWGILVNACINKGWHLIDIGRFTGNPVDITNWIEKNIKGAYHRNGTVFIFENYKDASWILLRWS